MLVIGAGTGSTGLYLAEQLTHTNAQVKPLVGKVSLYFLIIEGPELMNCQNFVSR